MQGIHIDGGATQGLQFWYTGSFRRAGRVFMLTDMLHRATVLHKGSIRRIRMLTEVLEGSIVLTQGLIEANSHSTPVDRGASRNLLNI